MAYIQVFAEEPNRDPATQWWYSSRGDGTSLFPPSGNEGSIRNREVPYQSVTLDADELGSLPKGLGYCPFQGPVEASCTITFY